MHRKYSVKTKLSELFGDIFETPSAGLAGEFSFTLSGSHEVYVSGCRSILSYGSECIILEISSGELVINGSELDISRYTDGELIIRGRIFSVAVSEDKKC